MVDFFKRMIDFFTLGSNRPIRRLVAYYLVFGAVVLVLHYVFPAIDRLSSGERVEEVSGTPEVLQDGLQKATGEGSKAARAPTPRLDLALTTVLVVAGTLALMLPVSWVYMSARRTRHYSQAIVQTLLILPIVVAGVILIVRNSLALAFSLAGVVAAIRFRTTVSDSRDIVFIFLAIGVGFATGVQTFTVAILLSVSFNFVLLLVWRYDFGRNVLEPTAGSSWAQPLNELAKVNGGAAVPDRDLLLALTPKKVDALAARFSRVRDLVGPDGKKARYNAVLSITTNAIRDTQQKVEPVLQHVTKRWKLDEVVTNAGKPSELYYLLRIKKSTSPDDLITEVRGHAGNLVESADVEIGEGMAKDLSK
jgi:hypothetical protein